MPDQATLDLIELKRQGELLEMDRVRRRKQDAKVRDNYRELVMSVGKKVPGENRHDTALRYIREAEAKPPGVWEKTKAVLTRKVL